MKQNKIVTMNTVAALCVGTILSVGPSAPAYAAEVDGPEVHWNLSLWGARRGFSEGLEGLADYVSQKTDGNFEITLHYGAVLSSNKENLDGLYLGAFEAAAFCPVYHPDKTPALGALDLAFLPIDTLEKRRDVIEAFYENPVVVEEFAKWKSVPLMGVMLPNYEAMGTGDVPDTLSTWQGMRISSTGGVGRLMAALDASVTVISAPDMFQSMERGVIDAATFPYTYAFAAYRLHEISTWVTDGWSLGAIVCHAAVTQTAYDALPDQYKTLLEEGITAGYAHQIQEYSDVDVVNEVLFEEAGLIRVPLSDEIQQAILDAAQPSWTAWVEAATENGVPGQELLDSVLSLAAR